MSDQQSPFHGYKEWLIYLATGLSVIMLLVQIYFVIINISALIQRWF